MEDFDRGLPRSILLTMMKAAQRQAKVIARAEDLFESKANAARWLKSPLRLLGGKTPLEMTETSSGAREVEQLLGRIEHGVVS